MLHVEGLATNLISISQLCDQNLLVKFTKNTCKVFNDSQECVLEGARTVDNCYKLLQSHTCHKTSLDEIKIWHQRLDHLNYKNLTKIVNTRAVHGASEEDESVNPTEVVENQVQKVNVTFDVTTEVAAESEIKMFDILIQLLKIP